MHCFTCRRDGREEFFFFFFFLNEPYFICLPYSALLLGLLDVVHICGAGENVSMAYSSRVGGHRLHLYGCH